MENLKKLIDLCIALKIDIRKEYNSESGGILY